MRKIASIILISITVSACHNVPMWHYKMFERPAGNRPYPEMYIKGWQDGCESGAEASANHFYRFIYEFKQDWQLLENRMYINGWENAYNHCRKYVLQHNLRKIGRS